MRLWSGYVPTYDADKILVKAPLDMHTIADMFYHTSDVLTQNTIEALMQVSPAAAKAFVGSIAGNMTLQFVASLGISKCYAGRNTMDVITFFPEMGRTVTDTIVSGEEQETVTGVVPIFNDIRIF